MNFPFPDLRTAIRRLACTSLKRVAATSLLASLLLQSANALASVTVTTTQPTSSVFPRLIAETTPSGALKRELIYVGDVPVGVVQ